MKFSIKSTDILTENLCFTDYVIVTEEISNLELEIERLNNIINELKKYLIDYSQDLEFRCYANTFLAKLQELQTKGKY